MGKWLPFVLVVVALVASALVYPSLPETIPSRWNLRGEVIDSTSRAVGAFRLPLMALGIVGLLRLAPRIDPRRANYARFAGTYDLVITALTAAFVAIHAVVLAAALGVTLVGRMTPLIVGVLFVVLGNVLPKTRPNWFFGIRTPWTLSDDTVWTRTHRVGGVVMVIAGLVVAAGAFVSPERAPVLIIGAAVALTAFAFGYSYYEWRRVQR